MKHKFRNKQGILFEFLSFIVALALLWTSTGVLVFGDEVLGEPPVAVPTPSVMIDSVSNTNNSAKITIRLINPEENVAYTVYYRTANGSAIAGKQFDALDSQCTLTRNNDTAAVYVQFRSNGVDTYGIDSFKATNGTTFSGTKSFVFELYYAESNGKKVYTDVSGETDGTVSIENGQTNVNVPTSSKKLPVAYDGAVAYLQSTMWVSGGYVLWSSDKDSSHEGGSGISDVGFVKDIRNVNHTSSGASSSSDVIYGWYRCSDDNANYYNGKGTIFISGRCDTHMTNTTLGSGKTYAKMYRAEYDSANYQVITNGVRAYSSAGFNTMANQSDLDFIWALFDGGPGYRSNLNGKNAVQIENGIAFMYFYKEYDSPSGALDIPSTRMSYTYYDSTAPSITGYYVQDGNYGAGQTIRLSVTFDELVRLRDYTGGRTPYLVATSASSVSGATSGDRLEFKYAGGDGTDTLYFEAVVPTGSSSSYMSITDLKNCAVSLYNFDDVVDLAYNSNGYPSTTVKSNNRSDSTISNRPMKDYGKATTLTVDNRVASVRVDSILEIFANGETKEYSYANNPTASVYGIEMNLKLTNVADGASIFYTFVNGYDATAPQSRGEYLSVNAATDYNGNTTATVRADNKTTGEYTLCVLYISPAFVRTSAAYNFYFDSDPPDVNLSASPGNNIFTPETHSFVIQATDDPLSKISKVEYALSRSGTASETELDRAGLFIALDWTGTNSNENKVTVTVGRKNENVTTGIDPTAAGKYYVYARLTDGNGVKIVQCSSFTLAFDFRSANEIADAFQCKLTGGGNSANDTIFGGSLTQEFGIVFYQQALFQWKCDNTTAWTITLRYNGSTVFTDVLNVLDDVAKQPEYLLKAGSDYGVRFEKNGYYELTISYSGAQDTFQYEQEVYVYGVGGVYGGDNYDALANGTRYIKTKYWQLLKSTYSKRNSDNTVKSISFSSSAGSVLPVFPDYESAYAYVRALEIQDIYKKVLTQADVDTILSGGQLVADNVTPRVGDTWYFYKSAGGTDINSYRWYYNGPDNNSGNLSLALHKNILRIVGSQTDTDYPNDYRYATFDKTLNNDTGNLFMSTDKTLGNLAMYDDTVAIGSDTAVLASTYSINSEVGRKLFARVYHTNDEYIEVTGVIGDALKTNVYEILEIGPQGAIRYLVYIDRSAPYVDLEITNGSGDIVSYHDITASGTATVYGRELLISSVKGEGDDWSVLSITKSNGNTVSMTVAEFYALGGYRITESGTYTVYVFDRSGNNTQFTVMLKKDEIALSAPTNADARNYTFSVTNRVKSEIASLTIYYNGVVQTVDANGNSLAPAQLKQLSFTFGYSGSYRVDVTDRYGYVLSAEFELEKPLPSVSFMVDTDGNGQYKNCADLPGYLEVSEDGTTYKIFSSAPLRIVYTDKNYTLTWVIAPAEGTYKYNGYVGTSYRHSLTKDAKNWICTISYASDPYSSLTIISLADDTPPLVSGIAEKNGSTASIGNLNTLPASSVTISWEDDDSPISKAVYTYNNTAPIAVDALLGSVTLAVDGLDGVYCFTVTNIVGLSQTFTFTVDNTIDLTVVFTNGEYHPKDGMVLYEHESVKLVLKEDVTILLSCNRYPVVSGGNLQIQIFYSAGRGISVLILQGNNETTTPLEIGADYLASLENDTVATGTSGTQIFDHLVLLKNYYVTVGKTADGELYIGLLNSDSDTEERVYSIAIDEQGLSAALEIRLSNKKSDIIVTDDNQASLSFSQKGVLAVNYNVSLLGQWQRLWDITEIYYVVNGQGDPIYLYRGEGSLFADTVFRDDGEYLVTVVNRYGNEMQRAVKIYHRIQLDTDVTFADGSTVRVDNEELTSNHSVTFRGSSDTEYTVQVESATNTISWAFTLDDTGENYVLTIAQAGSYRFAIIDSFGNTLSYHVTITPPEEKKTEDGNTLLTGWNTGALRADEYFTNQKLSFVSDLPNGLNTAYVFYTYYKGLSLDDYSSPENLQGETVIVRNLFDRTPIDRYGELRIGDDGDGLYVVVFFDANGNRIWIDGNDSIAVSYKNSPQFTLNRVVEGNREEPYEMSKALESGFWSNGSLIFTITAKEYLFTVNGESVQLDADGKYTITRANEEFDTVYDVSYQDDYGNNVVFQAHIYKKYPPITYLDESMVITLDSIAYVKGAPAFTSDALGVYASYTKEGGTAVPYTLGESISGDGSYVLTFTDIAGNTNEVRFTVDTSVDWRITVGRIGAESELFNGVASNKAIRISRSGSEMVTLVSVKRNGVDVSASYQNTANAYNFEEDGLYELVVADRIGNIDTISFAVITASRQNFDYTVPSGWFVSALSYLSDGVNVYVTDPAFLSAEGDRITLNGDWVWTVFLTERLSGNSYSFEVTTDNTAPTATFTGLSDEIRGTVTLTSVDSDATVEITCDGKKVSSTNVTAGKKLSISVSEPGDYRVVLTDKAGNVTEYTFTVEYTLNVFSIAMIAIGGLSFLALVFVVFRLRKTIRVR